MRRLRKIVGIPIPRIVLAALLLAVVSFGGTVIYLMFRPVEAAVTAEPDPLPASSRRLLIPIDVDQLEIPDEMERLVHSHWIRYRPPRDRWSAEEVERFWVDPATIGVEYLSEINRSFIEEMLQGIP